jgi:hypothetical protein
MIQQKKKRPNFSLAPKVFCYSQASFSTKISLIVNQKKNQTQAQLQN